MSEIFALLSSLGFATSHILIRRGLAKSDPLAGFCISVAISALTMWILAALYLPLSAFWTHTVWYFVVGGLFASGLGRWLVYIAIDKLGVARSIPVASTSPMFAAILAVFLVGEQWTLLGFLGTALIIGGVIIISRTHTQKMAWRRTDLIFPLMAALSFALSANVRKLGFLIENLPLMAASVNATTGLILGAILIAGQGGMKVLRMPKHIFGWFLAAGLCNTGGMLANLYALSAGDVVVVEPLISTNPVLSVILTAIFLKDVETVNMRVALGVALTFAGTLLLVFSKS